MTEEVRTDRLSEGLAGSCRDHAVDLRTHEGAAMPPGPEPVMPVRTRDPIQPASGIEMKAPQAKLNSATLN